MEKETQIEKKLKKVFDNEIKVLAFFIRLKFPDKIIRFLAKCFLFFTQKT